MRCFGDAKDTIDSKQLKNQIYLLRFGHTRALLFKKKRTRNGHFPRPRETDPYMLQIHVMFGEVWFGITVWFFYIVVEFDRG